MFNLLSKSIAVLSAVGALLLIAAFTNESNTQQFTLNEAIQAHSISANATSNGKYSGRSVDLVLVNKTQNTLQIRVPAGTLYEPKDDGEQTLIQMEDQLITLAPGGTYNGQVGAFCTEATQRCPSASNGFTISQTKNPKFNLMFAYLKGKKVSKGTYQDAVWAISDGHSVANIVTELPADVAFRKEIATITGQRDTWFTSPQNVQIDDRGNFNYETVKISGHLSFNCAPGTKVRQDIHKGNGEVFYASDKTMTAQAGNVNYDFHLSVMGWEKGTYYIRIHDGTRELGKYEFTV